MIYAGSMQRLHFSDLSGGPKTKICLTICEEPYLFFLVNSEVTRYIQSRAELSDCQVTIDKNNHDFILTHDSYLDCTDAYGIHEDELRSQLKDGRRHPKGNASKDVIKNVIIATNKSPKLTPRIQRFILDTLQPLVDHLEI